MSSRLVTSTAVLTCVPYLQEPESRVTDVLDIMTLEQAVNTGSCESTCAPTIGSRDEANVPSFVVISPGIARGGEEGHARLPLTGKLSA